LEWYELWVRKSVKTEAGEREVPPTISPRTSLGRPWWDDRVNAVTQAVAAVFEPPEKNWSMRDV
jgi:hypothetical protein